MFSLFLGIIRYIYNLANDRGIEVNSDEVIITEILRGVLKPLGGQEWGTE